METIKKNRSLIGIIIFLLVSNIGMLIFFLVLGNGTRKDHPPHKDIIATFLKNDMGFTQQQMDQYDKIHKDHMDKMKPFFDSVHSSKDNFYNLLNVNEPDSVVNKAAAVIGENQMSLDLKMFKHLQNVRNLCTPDQLPKFDSLFKNVIAKMTHRKPDPKTK